MIDTATYPTISSVLSALPSFPSLRRRRSSMSSTASSAPTFSSSNSPTNSPDQSPITPPSSNTPRFGPVDLFDQHMKGIHSLPMFSQILSTPSPITLQQQQRTQTFQSISPLAPAPKFDLIASRPAGRRPFGFTSFRSFSSLHEDDEGFEAGLSVLEPRPQGLGCVGLFEVLERW
jgi:hypothetical protein